MIEIECSAFFAAMNPKILTGSRCPWQRRPPLFSGCRAPQRGSDSRAATDAAPHARPRSGPQPHRSRPRPGATSSAVTAPSTPAHAPAAGSAGHWSATSGPPQPGTPSNTAVSLASTDILSARPDGPAIRCPRNRGNSTPAQECCFRRQGAARCKPGRLTRARAAYRPSLLAVDHRCRNCESSALKAIGVFFNYTATTETLCMFSTPAWVAAHFWEIRSSACVPPCGEVRTPVGLEPCSVKTFALVWRLLESPSAVLH